MRLWRGAPAIIAACVPSHAAYFSAYELGKSTFRLDEPGHRPGAAAAVGAFATLLHDAVMTPMDLVKQRLQLGYYSGAVDCIRSVVRNEGVRGLYHAYPTTVLMNIPYAAVVVAANESIKKLLTADGTKSATMLTFLSAGAGAGALAAVATCPLDVIKTRLQTVGLSSGGGGAPPSPRSPSAGGFSSMAAAVRARATGVGSSSATGPAVPVAMLYTAPERRSHRGGAWEVATAIWREEGGRALFRGVGARVGVHAPSMAISWGTYELVKGVLIGRWSGDR